MKFKTVLLDPPFPEVGGGGRGAQNHYPVIKSKHRMLRTILDCPHWPPADDAHVYMWSTDNYLTWAVWLLECFGAKLHRTIPWEKKSTGQGRYFRGDHELLLFATIGRGWAVRTATNYPRTGQLLNLGWRGEHSEKPPQQYDLIEARSKGPYLEMFARETRDGWTAWGDEIK